MTKIALITAIGGDIAQSIIKCLKDVAYQIDLLGCDIDNYAAGKKDVKKFFEAPPTIKEQEYLEFIKKLIKKEGVNWIFPTTDAEIEFYDKHRDYFNNIGLFINSSYIIDTFFDKYKTVDFLKNNDLPYPKTYLIEDYKNELSFPVLLKRRKGCGGKGLIVISSTDELNFYRERTKDAIIQEIIGAPEEEYTVGVFSTGERIYSISFKRILGYGGLSKVAQLIYDEELENLAKLISKASGLEGPLNIQLRKTPQSYMPFEINPRFSSTLYIRHCFGFQDVKWWIDLKEGREIEFKPKYKEGVAIRTLGEAFFDLIR